ncbi:MAG: hypothetical protein ABJE10_06710 [bacterium]
MALLLPAAALLVACHDTVVQPTPSGLLPSVPASRSGGFTDDANFGAFNSPASVSYDAVIDPWDAGSPQEIIGAFPYPTIMTATTTGRVNQVPGALNGDGLSWGPEITLEGRINGLSIMTLDSGGTTVVVSGGTLRARRVALGSPQPAGGLGWSCGAALGRNFPCWTFEGSAHLQLTRESVGMTLTSDAGSPVIMASRGASTAAARSITAAGPSSGPTRTVVPGTAVAFTAAREKDAIGGLQVYMTGVTWRWVVDPPETPDPTIAADTGACGTTPIPLCTRSLQHSGTMYATAYVNGAQVEQSLHVEVASAAVVIEIVSAKGPNGVGSFLTEDLEGRQNDPENRIKLIARVTPAALASQVRWIVEDLPGDHVITVAPSAPLVGESTSFLVPVANQGRTAARWPGDHTTSLAITSKRLAYRVTATVVSGGTTYRSKPDSVVQDSLDVLRQEYVDWDKRQKATITRAILSNLGDARRNSGDYVVWPSSPRLTAGMAALQTLAMTTLHQELFVTGGFRNPVHHHLHGGGGAHPAPESAHLYGDATDFRITDPPPRMTRSRYFTRIRDLAWDSTVGGCFEPASVITANGTQSLDHAHVDWRTPCSSGWGAAQ